MVTWDFQSQLVGAGAQDEVLQARYLCPPAEPADPPILQAMDPPSGAGRLLSGHPLELRVGQSIDQAGPEQGGWIACRDADRHVLRPDLVQARAYDRAVPGRDRLEGPALPVG